ncbi:ninjurin-1-like [Littorina saxatilis]|uniref:ninjurin-1-like n=1 Tax=Littorina saxatilis TaxID=31220 RepID=UPI0038B57D0F
MATSRNQHDGSAAINTEMDGGSKCPAPGAVRLQYLSDLSLSDNPDGEEVFTNIPFTPLLSNNQYTVRKMAAQAMMDVALMMANISQLRTLMAGGSTNITYFYLLISLVVFSLISQLVFGILIFIIWVRESAAQQREEYEQNMRDKEIRSGDTSSGAVLKLRFSLVRQREQFQRDVITNRLNHVTMVLVFLITVVNMFITGFGIQPPSEWSETEANNTPS